MSSQAMTKYEYIRKVDAICDLFVLGIESGATTPAELDLPALLAKAPEYAASLLPRVYPEVITAVLKPKNAQTTLKHSLAVKQYLTDLTQRLDEGQPVLYYYGAMSPEIFLGMDLIPLCYELLPIYISGVFSDGVEEELDTTHADGVPAHVCSAQKGSHSALAEGKLPKPDVLVKTGIPCDSSNMMYQYVMELYDAEVVVMDAPYYSNERAFRYYVDEYKRMIERLERLTGHTLDEERLRTYVQRGNRQLEYLYELQTLRRCKPNPDPGLHRPLDTASLLLCGINEQMVDYMKACYEEAQQRHQAGTSFLPEGRREIRTIWTWGFTGHMLYLPDWLEEEYGVTYLECALSILPAEVVGYVDTTSVESMIEGLAWRTLNHPMGRGSSSFADVWIEDFVTVANSYKADAAVFSGHLSCKHSMALAKMLSDTLQERAGIPSFKWETDLLDKRVTPHAAAKAQLAEFFTTLTETA